MIKTIDVGSGRRVVQLTDGRRPILLSPVYGEVDGSSVSGRYAGGEPGAYAVNVSPYRGDIQLIPTSSATKVVGIKPVEFVSGGFTEEGCD